MKYLHNKPVERDRAIELWLWDMSPSGASVRPQVLGLGWGMKVQGFKTRVFETIQSKSQLISLGDPDPGLSRLN